MPLDVKAGDTILFGKYSGQEIKLDGVEYLIMSEDEVLAVIETQDGGKKSVHGKADYVRRSIRARRFCAASTASRTR